MVKQRFSAVHSRKTFQGVAEFAGLEFHGLEFGKVENVELENDGLQVVKLHGTWLRHLHKRVTAVKRRQ